MKDLEQFVIAVLFIAMIAFPFSRVMENSHAKILAQQLQQQKLEKQRQLERQKALKEQKLAQIKAMIPQEFSKQKKAFMEIVLPAVLEVYAELENDYERLIQAVQTNSDSEFISAQMRYYGVDDLQRLLIRAKPHPKSIALAQAAIESAWATSRFYKKANNLFGVWSFNKNEPRVAASGTREGTTVWLRKYDSVKESIRDYYKTISTGFAYKEFRELNYKSDNALLLSQKLHRYSEKGSEYTKLLVQMIVQNKFDVFDNHGL
jgi:Bax protein